ncbi:hypothetical protein FRC04_003584 [Tulasnella sp. 424]|nr:hypothetical protein FRC04_003584 [Tulasnella sp. 424]KAG8965335.1 hypothetical protein FRC05_003280 [Tulasnella sp. 425]
MSVFRSTLSKQIAHTTILPALGNKDLKLLQDLITAEKFAVSSSQKLADDWAKAADALKAWGAGEGDDLGDVLDKSRELLALVSAALAQLSTHEAAIRVHMKAVRTREENLDELKRRRKQVGTKAESAEKKLSKMSAEHKHLQMQQDLLRQLREEMQQLDSTILVEEARLGDYKRQTTKDWMALKFGGLSELAEKVMIVGNTGKQLIEEIPLDQTQPGFGRVPYVSHTQTTNLVTSACQRVGEVTFQPTTGNLAYHYEPGPGTGHQQQQPHSFAEPSPNVPQQTSFSQRYQGGLPPQPEPHAADYSSEFGQYPGQQQQQPSYQSQTVSSATGSDMNRPYPPRMDSRFATLPNNVGRYDRLDEPPSPAVPPKDLLGWSQQPPQSSPPDPRQSMRRSASGLSETGADLVLAYYHDLEATGETMDSTGNADQAAGNAPGRRSDVRAPGSPSFDEDPYATDAFHSSPSHTAQSTFAQQRQPSYDLPNIQPLRPQKSEKGDDTKAADAAAALEIARELDISPSRPVPPPRSSSKGVLSKYPLDGGSLRGYPPNLPMGQQTFSAYDPQSQYGGPSSPTRHSGSPTSSRFEPAPTLSLSFSDADAKLDFPGISSPLDPQQTRPSGVMDDSRMGGLGARPRSPPPSFEVATSTPPTPALQPRNIPMANYEPSAVPSQVSPQPNPERSLSATSTMSDAQRQQQILGRSESNLSSASSLSPLPSPHPPFAADLTAISSTGRGGTASVMPGSANSPPLSPVEPVTPSAKTISAAAFKRFRGPGSSPAGSPLTDVGGSPLSTPFNTRKQPPPMEPTSSYQSAASGNSNYASAPSSPPAENSGIGTPRMSLEGPRAPGYSPSPLSAPPGEPQGYSRVSYISDAGQMPEGDPYNIGVAMGTPTGPYGGDGYPNDPQQSNRMTIGEHGWKPMRYASHVGADGLSEIAEESEAGSISRRSVGGGYGTGRYATRME